MNFDAFMETAWNDHGDRPQEVAVRIVASLHLLDKPEQIPLVGRLLAHIYGEHLGEWRRGIDSLESLRRLPAYTDGPAVQGALNRSIATLRYGSGEHGVLATLSAEDRIAVLAGAAPALGGRGQFKEAVAAYAAAVALADGPLPADSPALRALAVGGNNLAMALEQKADRDPAETAGMLAAARGGLKFWKLAGTWLEEGRAEYRLTHSLIAAGDHAAALDSARRCIEICRKHQAPAIELFFASTNLAFAQRRSGDLAAYESARDQALQLLKEVAAADRSWCESELEAIAR